MLKHLYSTDLSDSAWKLIARLLPTARIGGRPRTTDLRAVLNAIFYLLRTGCQWRLLPREFPAWGTVYYYFRTWKNAGVWVRLQRTIYKRLRQRGRSLCLSIGGHHGVNRGGLPFDTVIADQFLQAGFPTGCACNYT